MKLKKSDLKSKNEVILNKDGAMDEVFFKTIYNRYRGKVYSYALKIIKSKELAEDILHEIFLKVWQHENFTAIDNWDSYLRVITRNYTLKVLRRQKLEIVTNRRLLLDWDESQRETEEVILLNDAQKLLQEAIEQLPPQQRLTYRLCREDGLKYEEAAEKMAISRLTVKTHMQHALRFLRSYITRYTDNVLLLVTLSLLD